jgi:ABC transport system ATP-binding/permease protein
VSDLTAISMPPTAHELVIGRDENSDVVIDDTTISRRHCAIRRLGDSYVVGDLGSTNGTRLNGNGVSKEAVPLEVGDVLNLAGTVSYRRGV